jgi:hypothetical protein
MYTTWGRGFFAPGCSAPYMNIIFKKISGKFKKSRILGYQIWVPNLLSCEVSRKNDIHGTLCKKTKHLCTKKPFGWIVGRTVFSSSRIHFLVFFHETSHGSRLDTQVWYPKILGFLKFPDIFWFWYSYGGGGGGAHRSSCAFSHGMMPILLQIVP